MLDRAACEELDATDPLAALRRRFLLPEGVIYLDGNSLGAMPAHVPHRMREVISDEWGRDLITSWNVHGWVDLPRRVGDRIARLIGAPAGTVVACDSTSVNLFKAVSAALGLTERTVILSDDGNFPTDLYVMAGIGGVRIVPPERVPEAITPEVGVVALTHVGYATGAMYDMAEVTRVAHAAGALMVWDLAHSAGAMDVDVGHADFAVGCGYKYLNGGPGAPAFIYVNPAHLDRVVNPISGWFGHEAPFEFAVDFRPAVGIDRMRVGTPHLLSLAALDAALDVFDELDLAAVRAKSVSLTSTFVRLVAEAGLPLELLSPADPTRRGSQVCLSHPDGYAMVQALIDRGVIGDFRMPDVLRFGFAPLYVRHVDVWDAVQTLADVIESEAFRKPKYSTRSKVT